MCNEPMDRHTRIEAQCTRGPEMRFCQSALGLAGLASFAVWYLELHHEEEDICRALNASPAVLFQNFAVTARSVGCGQPTQHKTLFTLQVCILNQRGEQRGGK